MEPTLTLYKKALDQLCSDIVSVERFLRDRLVMIPCTMITQKKEGEEGPYRLSWSEISPGKFRLVYYLPDTGNEDEDPRPLAEAPLYLRIELGTQLPAFLKYVEHHLNQWASGRPTP